MQFSTILFAASALVATGTYAWTQDANGVWVANNTYYTIRGCKCPKSDTKRLFVKSSSASIAANELNLPNSHRP